MIYIGIWNHAEKCIRCMLKISIKSGTWRQGSTYDTWKTQDTSWKITEGYWSLKTLQPSTVQLRGKEDNYFPKGESTAALQRCYSHTSFESLLVSVSDMIQYDKDIQNRIGDELSDLHSDEPKNLACLVHL